jgi:uncharacterized protein YggE
MKTILYSTALFCLCAVPPAMAQDRPADPPVVITVGQAIVTAAPDRAFVTVAAESRSKNSAEAQRQNAAAMTAVLQKIQQSGISKDAIRTLSYDLQPEFDYANGRQTLRGYVARNTVEVRLDELDRMGAVLDAAGSGGATSIGGIRFDVRDRAGLEREALRRAVADARARADAMAEGAGRSIERVIRIEESGAPEMPRPMYRMAAVSEQAAVTPVSPSTVEIHVRVMLTAGLR